MSAPLVLFPDAVDIGCTLIREGLVAEFDETCPVVSKVPAERPSRFVLVRRTGGPRQDVVTDVASLTLESWGEDEEDAADLAQRARAVVYAARGSVVEGVTIYRITEFAGPAHLPDPVSQQPRYTQTIAVAMRGAAPVGS